MILETVPTSEDVGVDVSGEARLPHALRKAAAGGQHLPAPEHALIELHEALRPPALLFWRALQQCLPPQHGACSLNFFERCRFNPARVPA